MSITAGSAATNPSSVPASLFEELKQSIGERIYTRVMSLFSGEKDCWGKVTGMILESIDFVDVVGFSDNELDAKLIEAKAFYDAHIEEAENVEKVETVEDVDEDEKVEDVKPDVCVEVSVEVKKPEEKEEKKPKDVEVLKVEEVKPEEKSAEVVVVPASRCDVSSLSPAARAAFGYILRFPGDRNEKTPLSSAGYWDSCSDFIGKVCAAGIRGSLPIRLFQYVFNENMILHSPKFIRVPSYNDERAFYIRMLVVFCAAIKTCITTNEEFDVERYMRSCVYTKRGVFSRPFSKLWADYIINTHPLYELLNGLYEEIEGKKIQKGREEAMRAAKRAFYPSIEEEEEREKEEEERKRRGGKGKGKGKKQF